MHAPRVSIGGLMGVVAVIAVGAIGVKEGTATWAGATMMVALGLLVATTLAAVFGAASARPGRAGFALTGWTFLLASFNPWGSSPLPMPPMPTEALISELNGRIHPAPEYVPNPKLPPATSFRTVSYPGLEPPMVLKPGTVVWRGELIHVRQSAQALVSLVLAAAGGLAARAAFERPKSEVSAKPAEIAPADDGRRAADSLT